MAEVTELVQSVHFAENEDIANMNDDETTADHKDIEVSLRKNNNGPDNTNNSGNFQLQDGSPKKPAECSQSNRAEAEADEWTYQRETRRMRKLLKAYFYAALRYKSGICSINLLHCAMFFLQLIKVSVITSQMFSFGDERGNFSSIVNRGHLALTHLLIKGWDATWETVSYPPSHGAFALYNVEQFEEAVNFAVSGYYNARNEAIGFYVRGPSDTMVARITYFEFPGFDDSVTGSRIDVREKVLPTNVGLDCANKTCSYNIRKEFTQANITRPFKRLLSMNLDFNMHSVRVYEQRGQALCLSINGSIGFVDMDNNGRVKVNIESLSRTIPCKKLDLNVTDWAIEHTSKKFGGVVIAFSVISLSIAVVSLVYAVVLFCATKRFMKKYYQRFYSPTDHTETDLPTEEYLRFVRIWDIALIMSDCLTLYATFWISFRIKKSEWVLATLDSYTMWLGIGCILAWLNLLRYFKFTNKFHLLFRTLHYAIWDVMAYITCIAVLFVGYWVCGYVVMGPYHIKFKTPAKAMETLFALVNGDEIYTTLAILETDKAGGNWVFWFSRVYLGSYIAVFTIVVLNLLIALFMSAYDTIKNKDSPEELELGQLEKALRRFLVSDPRRSQLRSSLYELMDENKEHSSAEITLSRELSKLVRISSVDKTVCFRRLRTLKAFMDEEEDKTNITECGRLNCMFEVFSCIGNRARGNEQ